MSAFFNRLTAEYAILHIPPACPEAPHTPNLCTLKTVLLETITSFPVTVY